jgi:putative spermidine/putrescine transport system ATP-binding protein
MAHLTLQAVTKRFGAVTAVDRVSLEVGPGELLSLLGPSGCGKTTLLRMVAGFLRPDEGAIAIDGVPMTDVPPERRPTTMVFQNYALWPHKRVASTVAFGLRVRRLPPGRIRAKVAEVLELLGLEGLEDRYPRELSGGQQQRVALARALAVEPALLLLDEPLANLDAQLRVHMRGELRQLQRKLGTTMVYVTHDQEEALSLSDRVAVLHQGRLQQVGSPEEIYRRPATTFVAGFIGHANLIPGLVVRRVEGALYVRVQDGPTLEVHSTAATPVGSPVTLAIRAEDVPLAGEESVNVLPATVQVAAFLGAVRRMTATSPVGSLRIDCPADLRVGEGSGIRVYLPPDRLHLLAENAAMPPGCEPGGR